MVKILKCYLIPKKVMALFSKGAIFFGQPCIKENYLNKVRDKSLRSLLQNRKMIFTKS